MNDTIINLEAIQRELYGIADSLADLREGPTPAWVKDYTAEIRDQLFSTLRKVATEVAREQDRLDAEELSTRLSKAINDLGREEVETRLQVA